MQLLEVNNEHETELFHQVSSRVYQNDSNWIPHLYKEIEYLFDRTKNGAYEHGDARRWVLLDRNYDPAGRIAAFYNSKDQTDKSGAVGFYECLNKDAFPRALFVAAEEWLKKNGICTVNGPVNFGERHQFWGCLERGVPDPVYQENYNPGYYNKHFQDNGYTPYFDAVTYKVDRERTPSGYLDKLYKRVSKKNIEYVRFRFSESDKFVKDYLEIASRAFNLENRTVKIDKTTILNQLNIQRSVLKEDLIWFAYKDKKPVGVVGFMLNWSGILNNVLNPDHNRPKSVKGFLLAVIPEHQKEGILTGLLYHLVNSVEKNINTAYICGVAGYSMSMHTLLQKFNGVPAARHLTYRKNFDGSPIEAFPFFNF